MKNRIEAFVIERGVHAAALAAAAVLWVLSLNSCATSKKTVTAPDGTVTVTEESAPAFKDDTKQFAADVFWAFAPRQRPEHPKEVEPAK